MPGHVINNYYKCKATLKSGGCGRALRERALFARTTLCKWREYSQVLAAVTPLRLFLLEFNLKRCEPAALQG